MVRIITASLFRRAEVSNLESAWAAQSVFEHLAERGYGSGRSAPVLGRCNVGRSNGVDFAGELGRFTRLRPRTDALRRQTFQTGSKANEVRSVSYSGGQLRLAEVPGLHQAAKTNSIQRGRERFFWTSRLAGHSSADNTDK